MSLTQAEVEHVARLARMQLAPEETEELRVQLSDILEYVEKLQEVDVENVPLTSHITGMSTVMRQDEVSTGLSQEQVLSNAPDQNQGLFRVKAIFE